MWVLFAAETWDVSASLLSSAPDNLASIPSTFLDRAVVPHSSSVPDTSLLGGAPATSIMSQGIKGPKLDVVTF